MAVNLDEENSEIPLNNQSGNPSDDITPMCAAYKKAILKYLNEMNLLYTELSNDNIIEKN